LDSQLDRFLEDRRALGTGAPIHGLQQTGPRKVGTGTTVRLRHHGFAGDVKAANNHGQGWQRVLSWLQAFAESDETIDTREPSTAAG
jgi:hypothetical protein